MNRFLSIIVTSGLHAYIILPNYTRIILNKTIALVISLAILTSNLFCQDTLLAKAKQVTVNGNIQLTNNGTAPVPIFAVGNPAIMNSNIIRKGHFYFEIDLYFEMNLKPWNVITRLGYDFIDNKKWRLGLAFTPSLFFLKRDPLINNNEEFQTQRYAAGELYIDRKINKNQKIQFMYWHTIALDKLGIQREEFFNVAFSMENVKVGNKNIFTIRPAIFYLFDEKTLKGVFASGSVTWQRSKWKFNLFLQGALAVHVSPREAFIWNGGVNVPF